jgi:hypothetical protein
VKAIVVRQPWATLIALGVKTIETRPFPPNGPMRPEGGRGLPGCSLERGERIAIVAGAKAGTEVGEDLGDSGWYWESTAGDPSCVVNWKQPATFHDAPLGAVVCTVTVDDALPIVAHTGHNDDELYVTVDGRNLARQIATCDGSRPEHVRTIWLDDQLPLGDFTPGRWGYLLSDPQPCDPIPCKGRQGVFELPAEIAEALS